MKILVFSKNTPWGVIRKANGDLVYKHVMRFETEALKDEFIHNNLLTEEQRRGVAQYRFQDWKKFMEPITESVFEHLDDRKAVFRATPNEFNLTFLELRNADFCAVEIEGEMFFYALRLEEIVAGIFTFDCEIDLFFTHKIEFREGTENYVERAHLDRLNEEGTKFKSPSIDKFPELSYAKEPFEVPLVQSKITELENPDNSPTEWKWAIIYFKETQGKWISTQDKEYQRTNLGNPTNLSELPYTIYVMPFRLEGDGKININLTDGTSFNWNFDFYRWYGNHNGNPRVLKVIITDRQPLSFGNGLTFNKETHTINISQGSEEDNWRFYNKDWREYTKEVLSPVQPDRDLISQLGDLILGTDGRWMINVGIIRDPPETDTGDRNEYISSFSPVFQIRSLRPVEKKTPFKSKSITKILLPNKNFPNITDIENNIDPKIWTEQFSKIGLKHYFSELKTYSIPLAINNELKFNIFNYHNWAMEKPTIVSFVEEKRKENLLLNNFIEHTYTSQLPLQTDLKEDYLLKNKNQIATQRQFSRQRYNFNSFKSLITASLGLAAAPFSGGLTAVASAGAVISGASGVVEAGITHNYNLQKIDSALDDLRDQIQPDRVQGVDYYEHFTYDEKTTSFQFVLLSPLKEKTVQIQKFLNMFGYQLNYLLHLNDLLNTRKYWNFLKANDSFNTLKADPKLSSPQKQVINNAISEGITFWHYRGQSTWKGVLSFGRENMETRYQTSESKSKNDKKILPKN